MESIKFGGVTKDKFNKAISMLAEHGVTPTGDVGEVTMGSYKVRYEYDKGGETMTLSLLSKPWMVPAGLIKSKVKQALLPYGILEIV